MSDAIDRFARVKRKFGLDELLQLAAQEGLRHRASGRNRSECPGCRNGDPRGASLGENAGVGVWKCQRDDDHRGTAIDLLSQSRNVSTVHALAELERISGQPSPERHHTSPANSGPPPPRAVAELWSRCSALGFDAAIAKAWAARGIDVAHVEDRQLARVLPLGADVPRWAWGPAGAWSEGPHRLLVPLFDDCGRLASLHARAQVGSGPKGLSPARHAVAGLVMADPLARLMLAGSPCGNGEPSADVVRRNDLVVTEGVPDFLTWATRWGDAAEDAPAVIGMISGSWTDAIAARVPDGTPVVVREHADEGGAKYSARVVETLSPRCTVSVSTSEGEPA